MTKKKLTEKQKTAKLANLQSHKERLTIASRKAPLGVSVSPRADSCPIQEAQPENGFPIVGIGASAGGLAAFEAFFSGMHADINPGMAFVLVQHLAPDHESILADLIRRYTRMQVFEVEDGMVVQPNCAYIIPPNRDMAFFNGTLQLMEPTAPRGQRMPIDFFFRSLALDQHERAIGIVLSGTGSDGTQGVRAIKGEGGMIMAQKPESIEYDGMPRSAIATGLVDYVLHPSDMPAQLMAYVAHIFGKIRKFPSSPKPNAENAFKKIFILLRAQTGHDFSQYKLSTIKRRIERRMAVQQIKTMEGYVKYLQQIPAEVEALFRDLLIGVTSFFRDPEAFKALDELIIPRLFAGKPAGSLIRVWSAGCSTGEEGYSLAILLAERAEAMKMSFNVQIFATDIDRQAIATARIGLYPASIAADISPERLERFFAFEPDIGAYRIRKGIRDMLIFSEQDVIRDPPFSKLDLISCRNLLIYMGGDLQKKLIPLFHYSLNPGGFLFLGTSETVGEFGDLFIARDRKLKLYQRTEDIQGTKGAILGQFVPLLTAIDTEIPHSATKKADEGKLSLRDLTEKTLLDQIAPAAALVRSQGDILYLHGRTGLFLEPAPGVAGISNILRMAREGLQKDLAIALHKANGTKEIVYHPGLRVKTNGGFSTVRLTIRPVASGSFAVNDGPLYLVILEEEMGIKAEQALPTQLPTGEEGRGSITDSDPQIAKLKQELRAKEEYLQTTNEELETTNEELKSTNEEMQSVNEELATLNAELQTKVADLSQVNNDMNNLLAGTEIGTIFVDHQLRIMRFTPAVTRTLNLINSDVGRPLGHIVTNLTKDSQLVQNAKTVLDTLVPKEIDVQTQDGGWYSMRILPYRTLENVIEGVVIAFVNITEVKKTEEALRETEKLFKCLFENALNAVTINEIVLDAQGKPVDYIILQANPAFEKHTGLLVANVLGKRITQIYPGTEKTDIIQIYGKVALTGEPASFKRFFENVRRCYSINAYQIGNGRFAVVFEEMESNHNDRPE
jgi:two-component system, chemotaxis family, CheB/CheR fusion protein